MTRWISIKDQQPPPDVDVLIVYDYVAGTKGPHVRIAHVSSFSGEFVGDDGRSLICPSFWMQLPTAPVEQLGIGHCSLKQVLNAR